jgi:hypothetical protein
LWPERTKIGNSLDATPTIEGIAEIPPFRFNNFDLVPGVSQNSSKRGKSATALSPLALAIMYHSEESPQTWPAMPCSVSPALDRVA